METCTICSKEYKNVGAHKNMAHKDTGETKKPEIDISALVAKIESLEKKDLENQEKLKALYEVSDKGRMLNYENKQAGKQPMKVKLSIYDGKLIIGWRTMKDIKIFHPTTGVQIGEEQQMEVLLLDKEGKTEKTSFNSYSSFSDARYTERIEAEVIGKKEDYQGNLSFDLLLPDGRQIELNSRFVN